MGGRGSSPLLNYRQLSSIFYDIFGENFPNSAPSPPLTGLEVEVDDSELVLSAAQTRPDLLLTGVSDLSKKSIRVTQYLCRRDLPPHWAGGEGGRTD